MPRSEPQNPAARARLAPFVPDLRDLLVLAGLALLATGAWMIYRPAAFLVVGVVFLALGLFGVPKWGS